jgi:hypothetical protein
MPHSNLIRKYFSARLTDDFVFTSPYDDHIGRATYFKRCWPYSERSPTYIIEALFEKSNDAFIHGLFNCTDPWP